MKVNAVAFCTSTALAAATAGSALMAAAVASIVATVAYAILGITFAGLSIASITAWLDKDSVTVDAYFSKLKEHAGYAIAGLYQFVAHSLIQAMVQGLVDGIIKALSRKIGGDDRTIHIRHTTN
jgi:hypothetical protein